ncbi:hypothetical protein BH23PLA1_BH23PLA1_33610 [soil metagenome]
MDLDNDGNIDLISGSWPGEIFFFKGGPDRTFAPPIKLKHKDGKPINAGGGLRDDRGDSMLLIAGDAKFEERDGKQVVVYNDEVIEVPEGRQVGITGTASAVFAFDWDDDGDLDLIVGDISGNVYLVPNEGTLDEFAFGEEVLLQAVGKPIRVEGDAGPHIADWTGNGLTDLIVGAGDGSVTLFENVGEAGKPELAEGQVLVPSSELNYTEPPDEPTRGIRAKVCVADFNGDGLPDLLLGDYTIQKPDLPEFSPEELARHDKLRREQEAVNRKYSELIEKVFGANRIEDEDDRKAVEDEMRQIRERMQELYQELPQAYDNHGWVWLFLRRPAGSFVD